MRLRDVKRTSIKIGAGRINTQGTGMNFWGRHKQEVCAELHAGAEALAAKQTNLPYTIRKKLNITQHYITGISNRGLKARALAHAKFGPISYRLPKQRTYTQHHSSPRDKLTQ